MIASDMSIYLAALDMDANPDTSTFPFPMAAQRYAAELYTTDAEMTPAIAAAHLLLGLYATAHSPELVELGKTQLSTGCVGDTPRQHIGDAEVSTTNKQTVFSLHGLHGRCEVYERLTGMRPADSARVTFLSFGDSDVYPFAAPGFRGEILAGEESAIAGMVRVPFGSQFMRDVYVARMFCEVDGFFDAKEEVDTFVVLEHLRTLLNTAPVDPETNERRASVASVWGARYVALTGTHPHLAVCPKVCDSRAVSDPFAIEYVDALK